MKSRPSTPGKVQGRSRVSFFPPYRTSTTRSCQKCLNRLGLGKEYTVVVYVCVCVHLPRRPRFCTSPSSGSARAWPSPGSFSNCRKWIFSCGARNGNGAVSSTACWRSYARRGHSCRNVHERLVAGADLLDVHVKLSVDVRLEAAVGAVVGESGAAQQARRILQRPGVV